MSWWRGSSLATLGCSHSTSKGPWSTARSSSPLSRWGPHFQHRRFASCKCVYVFGGFWTNHHKRINEPLFCQPIINRLLYSPNSALSICYLCVMTNTEVRKWRNTASLILMVSIGDHPGGIPWRLRELGRAAVFDDARLDPGVGQTDCLDSKLPVVVRGRCIKESKKKTNKC